MIAWEINMNNYKKRCRFWVSCSFLVFSFYLSGCALTKEFITVDYTPQKNIEPIRGAEKVNLKVNMNDVRSMRD